MELGRSARWWMWPLSVVIASGCARAPSPQLASGAREVRTRMTPPHRGTRLRSIRVVHGSGCHPLGKRGTAPGVDALLRNEAVKAGANYVHITKITLPQSEGLCPSNLYTIEGVAYRVDPDGAGRDAGLTLLPSAPASKAPAAAAVAPGGAGEAGGRKRFDTSCAEGVKPFSHGGGFLVGSARPCPVWLAAVAPGSNYALSFGALIGGESSLGVWTGSYRGGDVEGRIVEFNGATHGFLVGDYRDDLASFVGKRHHSPAYGRWESWRIVRAGGRLAFFVQGKAVFVEEGFDGPELGFRVNGGFQVDQVRLDTVSTDEVALVAALPVSEKQTARGGGTGAAAPRLVAESARSKSAKALVGKQPWDILSAPEIADELKRLLGKEYQAFVDRLGVGSANQEDGEYVVGMGIMPRRGGSEEAYFAIGLSNGELHAAIRKAGQVRAFTSTKQAPPEELTRLYGATEARAATLFGSGPPSGSSKKGAEPKATSSTLPPASLKPCSGTMGPAVKGAARFEQLLPQTVEQHVLEAARTFTCKRGVEVWGTYRFPLTGTTVTAVIQLGPGALVPTEHLTEYRGGLKARVYDKNLWVQYRGFALFIEVSSGDPRDHEYFYPRFDASGVVQAYRAETANDP